MIIDEYQYVKNILKSKEKPKEISIKKLITYIAKYFYKDYKNKELSCYKERIFKTLSSFKMDSSFYRESLYDDFVNLICKKIRSGQISTELPHPTEIKLTQKEMDIIKSAPTEKDQKLIFTMYVLAKTRKNSSGWVNYSLKEIFQCANINIKRDKKILMINDLKSSGIITTSKSYKRVGFKVNYKKVSKNNPYVFIIKDFNNIGNQYIVSVRNGWKMCKCCGRLIKIKATEGRPQKYCSRCATIIESQNAKIRMQKQREK